MADDFEENIEHRFTIQHEVGRGAFGEVFRGVDDATGQVVAIKRLLASTSDPSAMKRFRLEARLLGKVDSPHVVRHIAHGSDSQGRLCLVLEWLEGQDLARSRLHRTPPIAEALDIARQAALGLEALHRAGIVHRDIKPSNFFLLDHDRGGPKVKLIDLGIARVPAETHLTVDGLRIGTPAYMSPEQARGDEDVSVRSDLYSLGVVLYELLAGCRPFTDSDPFALLAKIVLQDPPSLRSRAPGVWPELEAVVARAMAKAPERRFGSAAEMADALVNVSGWTPDSTMSDLTTSIEGSFPTRVTGGEQRVVAALFAGFATDEAHARGARLFNDAVAAHRGVVHQTLGRRAFGVFGQERSVGDEALCAARTALQIQRSMTGVRLAITTCRVRINTAGTTVGVSGDAIERGVGQLDRPGGEVRIDAPTARLLGGYFNVEGAEGDQVVRDERPRAQDYVPRLLGRNIAIAGRDRELAAIDDIFEEVSAEPVARVVLVTAPAGVGKTRVCHEWLRRLPGRDRPAVVLVARGDPMRAGSPFGLIAELLRTEARVQDGEALDASRLKLRERVARSVAREDVGRVAEFLGEVCGVPFPDHESVQLRAARQDPVLMGDQMRRAWEDFLGAECRTSPVVLVLEDLHWGDLPSVRFVDSALRVLADHALMVLASARPEVSDLFPGLWKEQSLHEMRLGALTRRASEKLVRDALGAGVADETVARVVERAGGNAFYLEELVRAIAEGRRDELPETVLLMAQARLERLEPQARQVLRAASVFGMAFWRGGALALVGSGARGAWLAQRLAELVQREVISRKMEGKFPGEEEYVFAHALLREAAYAMLTDEDRATGHRLAGLWLEEAGERDAMVLAEHFERGKDPARALRWYLQAAEIALEGNDLATANARAERGILCGATGEVLGRLRLVQAETGRWVGTVRDVQQASLEALALLPRGSAAWCAAIRSLAFACLRLGVGDPLAELVEELDDAEARAASPPDYAVAVASVAQALSAMGRRAAGEALLARLEGVVSSLAETHPASAAVVLRAQAEQALRRDDLGGYLALLEPAVAACERAGDLRGACNARAAMGGGFMLLGDHARAEGILREVAATAERLGVGRVESLAKHNLGLAVAYQGRLDEALGFEREALAAAAAQGNLRLESRARVYLSIILEMQGSLAAAEEAARAAVEGAAAIPPVRALALGQLAAVLRARGQPTEALAAAREAMDFLERAGGLDEGSVLVRLAHAEALGAAGHTGPAKAALADACTELWAQAERIADLTLRANFLHAIPAHERALRLAGEWLGEGWG